MDRLVINTKDNIINFLERSSDSDVMKYFFLKFNRSNCNYVIGEGHSAYVLKELIGPTAKIYINGSIIEIPVVKKIINITDKTYIKQIKKDIFIYGENATGEVLTLIKFRQLHSPHLHTLIDYSCCGENSVVTEIVTEEQGLGYISSYFPKKMYKLNWKTIEVSTSMGTINEILYYIITTNTNIFPNNTKFEFVELIDYLLFSFLITYDILLKNNIMIFDIHLNNIFIHWLNPNSYFGNKKIGETKEIVYKFEKKYYKFKTFGILPKIGDVGEAIMKIKNRYIVGNNMEIPEKTHAHIKKIFGLNNSYEFINQIHASLPPNDSYCDELKNKINMSNLFSIEEVIKTPSCGELIKIFKKYEIISPPVDDEYTLLI